LSEIVRDLVRLMLRMRWDDATIVFHLKSAKIRNAQKILDSVLDEAKKEAIARISSRNRYVHG
jgi:Arc/MetJ-type ribon-helix-helix transcriptional regulator